MSTETEEKNEQHGDEGLSPSNPSAAESDRLSARTSQEPTEPVRTVAAPSQFGTQRFVYAGYFALGMAVAFLSSKAGAAAWNKIQLMQPQIGEPRDEVLMPVSAAIGIGVVLYLWRQARTRELAEEVAVEMASVTWPGREEVTNGTTVVIATTLVATVFFALMDRFWSYLTNLVYGT